MKREFKQPEDYMETTEFINKTIFFAPLWTDDFENFVSVIKKDEHYEKESQRKEQTENVTENFKKTVVSLLKMM